jgi:hypothetical protein
MSHEKYQSCIDACLECAVACTQCASECLKEEDVKMMARCILLDRECAAVCFAAAELMTIGGEFSSMLCTPCAEICEECAEECENHETEHCKKCAAVCRQCAEECRKMAQQLV